jgi:hypothetical protein
MFFLPIFWFSMQIFGNILYICRKFDTVKDFFDHISHDFHRREVLDTKELKDLLSKFFYENESVNDSTLGWRIHDLKQKNFIKQVGRGLYVLSDRSKREFRPEMTDALIDVFYAVEGTFPYLNLCVGDTRWYNEFMVHQVFKNALIVEVEKEAVGPVFHKLTETFPNVFINPSLHIFETYISEKESSIIVKPLITESPIVDQDEIKLPSLEKMLVDLICDDAVYSAQSSEISNIFNSAMEIYVLNLNKLKRYARRRNKVQRIDLLIKDTLNHDSQKFV